MWKPEHRATADRRGLRYESDLTDAEWALVAPLIRPAKRGGQEPCSFPIALLLVYSVNSAPVLAEREACCCATETGHVITWK